MRTLKRVLCWLSGHEMHMRLGADSLSLYCPFCSYESRGWVLDRPKPRPCVDQPKTRNVVRIKPRVA